MFYEYYPLWKTFFNQLGAEVILSQKTTKETLNDSIKYCINDACLPVKLFHGHAMSIAEQADYLFIPRIKSIEKLEYICPKISGLPEMIKFSLPSCIPIIDVEVNLRKSKRNLKNSFEEAGLYLTSDKKRIKQAAEVALCANRDYVRQMTSGKLPLEVLDNALPLTCNSDAPTLAVLGHSYNLYDEYLNMGIMKKLNLENLKVLTPEMLSYSTIQNYSNKIGKKVFWSLGKRQIGALFKYIEQKVEGIIYVMAFGCGIDSFIADLCERYAKRSNIPFYLVVLDEHSGEAGLNTRLEAFVDMIRWRKKDGCFRPAYR